MITFGKIIKKFKFVDFILHNDQDYAQLCLLCLLLENHTELFHYSVYYKIFAIPD